MNATRADLDENPARLLDDDVLRLMFVVISSVCSSVQIAVGRQAQLMPMILLYYYCVVVLLYGL